MIKVMINKDNYVTVCIDHCLKFVCLSIGANFHSTYICSAYSNIREIFVSRKRIYSAEIVEGCVGGKLLSMLLSEQKKMVVAIVFGLVRCLMLVKLMFLVGDQINTEYMVNRRTIVLEKVFGCNVIVV